MLGALDLFRFETEIENFEIRPDVAKVGGAVQWHHANLQRKPEHSLRDCPTVACGDPGQLGTGQFHAVVVSREKPC
jgi:hypothetical protein